MSVHRILLSVLLSCGLILPSGAMFATGNDKNKISKNQRRKLNKLKRQEEEQKLKEQQEEQGDKTPSVTSAWPPVVTVQTVSQPEQPNVADTSIVPAHSNDDLVSALEGLKQSEETEKQNDASTSKQPQGQKEADLSSGSSGSFTSNSESPSDSSSSSPSTSHIVSSSDGSTIKKNSTSDSESPVEFEEQDGSQFKESPKPTPKSTPEPSRTAPIIDPLTQSGLIKNDSSALTAEKDASNLPTVRVDLNVDTSSKNNSSSLHASGEDTDNESRLPQPVTPSIGQAGAESPKSETINSSVQTEPSGSVSPILDNQPEKDSGVLQDRTDEVPEFIDLDDQQKQSLPSPLPGSGNDLPSVSSTITVDQKELMPSDVHSQQNSQGEEEEDSAYHSMPEQPQDPSATLNEQNLEPSKQTSSDDATISADEKKDQTPLTPSTNEQPQEVLQGEQQPNAATLTQDEPTINNQAPDQAPRDTTVQQPVTEDVTQNTTPAPQQVEDAPQEQDKQPATPTPDIKQEATNKPAETNPEDVLPGLPSDNELKHIQRTFNAKKQSITPELIDLTGNQKLAPVLKEVYGNALPKHLTYQELVDKLKAHYAAFTAHDKLKTKVEQLEQLMNKDVQSVPSRDIGMSKEEQEHIKDVEKLIVEVYDVVVDLQKSGYLQGGWFATVMKSLRGHPVLTSVGCVSVAVLGYVGYNIATLPDEVVINSEPTDIQESQEAAPAA